jgi:hypothetical protein
LGRLIVGVQRLGSAVAEPLAQVAHGARGQTESGGEAGRGFAPLGALE